VPIVPAVKVDATRRARIELLKTALQRGTYAVDPVQVAAAILTRSLERLRAGAN
jgi:anti-sigma28 factor (negative regulator of flagellin synthesis)